ncbi:MAG: aldo/keto reductase [Mycobacteriales bacterium]
MTSRNTAPVPPGLGFGGAPIGGLYAPVQEGVATATVRRAYETGIRYFDTAPHYGAGLAETRLGRALAAVPRDTYALSTKVGRRLAPGAGADPQGFAEQLDLHREWDFSAGGIRRCLEDSLARLGVDRVDVAYLHDPDDHEDAVYATAFPALAALRDEGLVGAIGAGMNQSAMLTRFVNRLDIDIVLLAGRYTLLDQSGLDDLLPACLAKGVSVVIGGVYNSGLLADPRPGARYDYAEAPPDLVTRAKRVADACAAHGVSVRAAALRFPTGHPAVANVLVGCRTPEEVDDNVAMFGTPVPAALWDDLRSSGLLREDAPVPEAR